MLKVRQRILRSDKIKFLLILVGILAGGRALAEDPAVTEEPAISDVFEEKMVQSNIAISEWFNGVAENLDLFLTGRRLTKRQNETSISIENSTTLREREGVSDEPAININLRLPNVEEYWNLKFTSYNEQVESRNVPRGLLPQNPRDRNYGATVGVFRKLGNVRASFEPRVELQDPLKVSHALTFQSVADTKTYKISPKLQFYANPDQGTGVFTAFNFDFTLSKIYSLLWINQGDYQEKSHFYRVTHGLALGQVLTEKAAMTYGFFTTSTNQSVYHLDGYTLSVSYSEVLYKKILTYSLTPHLDFSRDTDYTGIPGITLGLNLYF